MASPIIRDYHIISFPSYYLIAPDSTIVETSAVLREYLEEVVADLLQ